MREQYCGFPFEDEYLFDVEMISNIIHKFTRGEAAGLNSLAAEHLIILYIINSS